MKRRLKKMSKDALTLTTTGIGLGIGASAMSSSGASAEPITKFSSKMPLISGVVATGHTVGIIQDSFKIKKKKMSWKKRWR